MRLHLIQWLDVGHTCHLIYVEKHK
jgi:hypothetical protein